MGLPKGRTNNKNGRPKGSVNKLNAKLREGITEFLCGEFKNIEVIIKKLPPRDRVKAFCDLLQYGLPKLTNTNLEINNDDLLPRPTMKLPDGTEIEL